MSREVARKGTGTRKPCIGNDPTCPCQDGDMCHYRGPNAWLLKPKLSEADVQQAVVQFLELDGWRSIRTDPVSDRARGKGFGEVGMPDYLFVRYEASHFCQTDLPPACLIARGAWARVLWIEFKRAGQKPKPHQQAWIDAERTRGALVMVVDDVDAFRHWYFTSGLNRRIVPLEKTK